MRTQMGGWGRLVCAAASGGRVHRANQDTLSGRSNQRRTKRVFFLLLLLLLFFFSLFSEVVGSARLSLGAAAELISGKN